MRIRAKLKRLKNPDPQYVSLVARGSNHIPFRIMKHNEGKTMIDLNSFTRIFKSVGTTPDAESEVVAETPVAPAAAAVETPVGVEPTLAAVVVMKGLGFDEAKAVVASAGLKVDDEVDQADGTVLFGQGDDDHEKTTIVKSGDILLVCKGFEAHAEKMLPFNQRVGVTGFHLSLGEAVGALHAAFTETVQKAASPEEAMAGVNAVMDDFNLYVDGLLEGLPAGAFKAQILMGESITKSAPEAVQPVAVVADAKSEVVAPEPQKAPVAADGVEVPAETPAAVVVAKSDDTGVKMLAMLEQMVSVQKSQGDTLTTLSKRQDDLDTKIATSIQKADAATAAVKGTIAAPASLSDLPAIGQDAVQKADLPFGGGYFDTAMDRAKTRK